MITVRRLRILPVALVVAAAACAHAPPLGERERAPEPGAAEIGIASFYGRELNGSETASGTRYDMRAMTCAHRRHPFGAWLRVTVLETGRSVEVLVNDRGPFVRGRVVDLSYAAARALGILEQGLARVRVERVR